MGMYVCERCIKKHDLEVDERGLRTRSICELCHAIKGFDVEVPTKWVVAPHRDVRSPRYMLRESYLGQLKNLPKRPDVFVRASDGKPLNELTFEEFDPKMMVRRLT